MKLVPVCLDTFLKILHVSRFRLNILSKNFYATGQLPCKRRGGDRKSIEYAPKKESVMNFLNKLKCVESHYCRSAVSSRMYLPSELNIRKLHRMYDGIPVKVVKGCSKGKLNHQTVTSYCWTENQFPKGSNEISSCVYDTLQTTDLTNFSKIRLMSDGCAGQNKNSTLVAMLCKWLLNAPGNITEIEIVFPVTGHSFIPHDRVFGLSEKEIKRQEIILFPEEYQEIFSHYATVKNLGTDCPNLDWKAAKDKVLRLPGSWHFKLKQSKRIILKRSLTNKVLVQGEMFYKSFTGAAQSICKRGKSIAEIQPDLIPKKNSLHPNKKNDVNALLSKHYGDDWRENNNLNLDFYKYVLDESDEDSNDGGANGIDELCEPQDIVLEPRI
nr:unnamed protein product [Callosobruchus chinensis]